MLFLRSILRTLFWVLTLVAALQTSPVTAMTPQPSMAVQSVGSGLCLDIAGAGTASGASAVQSSCSGARNQSFRLEPVANGTYQIVGRNANMCLDAPGATKAAGTQIIQWSCNQAANQQWQIARNQDGSSFAIKSAISGLCLAVAGGSTAPGGAIVQDTCSTSAFQKFVLGGGVAFLPDQTAAIQAVHSGMCINVAGGSQSDNGQIIQWTCNGGASNSWTLTPVAFFYRLTAQHSGKCLSVPSGSNTPGAQLIQSTCQANNVDQLFALIPDGSGEHYHLYAPRSQMCVDVAGASLAPGGGVVQYPCGTQVNQSFNLIRPALAASWGAGPTLDMVAAAMASLPNGKIMFWAASSPWDYPNYGQTWTSIYDPAAPADKQLADALVTTTGHDMFCPGTTLLADGTLLVNGGNSNTRTSAYNPATNSWTALAPMNYQRGYEANTILPNGAALTVGGNWSGNYKPNGGEMYRNGAWTALPGIDTTQMLTVDAQDTGFGFIYRADNHMWLIPVSGGRILHAGPSKMMHWISVKGQGSVTAAGLRGSDPDAMNGNAVLYDGQHILTDGGAQNYQSAYATANANVIDTAPAMPVVTAVAPMTYPRGFHNSVVLPSGQVLVVGGMTYVAGFSDNTAVLPAELWDPGLATFQLLPAMATPRTYHGTAVLMMDGRVIVAGGGLCGGGCVEGWINNHPNTEIITPPYLYDNKGNLKTSRPKIASAPASAKAGTTITVATDVPVSAFSLVRFGADTHSVDNDQRRIPLTNYTSNGTSYSLVLPTDTSVLLPGYYMLFAMDGTGTPSKAVAIQILVTAS